MMWKTESPRCLDAWEPIELRMLKWKLATLDGNCRCSSATCEYNPSTSLTKESISNTMYQLDQYIQTVDFEENTPNVPKKVTTCDNSTTDRFSYFNIFNKNDICPVCYLTQNMLRVVPIRTLKDEQNEIKPEIFSCDKSTSKTVESLEAATSQTFKPALKSSCLTFVNTNDESMLDLPQSRGSAHREVTFALENRNKILTNPNTTNFVAVEQLNPTTTCSHCACARIIDSIRPRSTWLRTHED